MLFLPAHHRRALPVALARHVDALFDDAFEPLPRSAPATRAPSMDIAESDSAYIATPKLPPVLVDEIRALLLGLSTRDEEGRRILSGRKTNINGFVEVKDNHYDDVRKVAQLVHRAEAESP